MYPFSNHDDKLRKAFENSERIFIFKGQKDIAFDTEAEIHVNSIDAESARITLRTSIFGPATNALSVKVFINHLNGWRFASAKWAIDHNHEIALSMKIPPSNEVSIDAAISDLLIACKMNRPWFVDLILNRTTPRQAAFKEVILRHRVISFA